MFKLFRYLKKYWWAVILAPAFMIVEVAMDMSLPAQMKSMVDSAIDTAYMTDNLEPVLVVGGTMIGYVFIE